MRVVLGAPVQPLPEKRRFVRASCGRQGDWLVAFPDGWYGSHLVAGLRSADVLLDVPAGDSEIQPGAVLAALRVASGDA